MCRRFSGEGNASDHGSHLGEASLAGKPAEHNSKLRTPSQLTSAEAIIRGSNYDDLGASGSSQATIGSGNPNIPSNVMSVLRQAMREEIFSLCFSGDMERVDLGAHPRQLPRLPSMPQIRSWPTKAAQKTLLSVRPLLGWWIGTSLQSQTWRAERKMSFFLMRSQRTSASQNPQIF